ncbi:MAG: InlB B-repeat-containing protein, partial [Clostridia bacterium]|nr:InlB B-repeat-containing protein [Clostridia bacterium]
MQNISVSGTAGWVYWNSSTSSYAQIPTTGATSPIGYGVFCRITGAMITDLIVENFDYQNMPATSTFVSPRGMSDTGGLVGRSNGDDTLLNCHTSGVIASNISYSGHNGMGGVVGAHSVTSTTINFYRCSSISEIMIQMSGYNVHVGGILGDGSDGGNVYVYDCAANLTSSVTGAGNSASSAAVGCLERMTYYMENFVGTVKVITTLRAGSGAAVGYYGGSTISAFKNCYVEGKHGTTGVENILHPIAGTGTALSVNNTTISNVNAVVPTGMSYPSYTSGNKLSGYSENATTAAMITKAQTFFSAKAYSNIWDTDKLGADYNFTPDESPVRNYLLAFVSYRNLEGGGATEVAIPLKDGKTDGDGFVVGDTLYVPTDEYIASKLAANHVFLGWTDDKDGKNEPFTVLPSGFYDEVTLYAVWGLPDEVSSKITSDISASANTIEYNGEDTIKLSATVTVPSDVGMTGPTYTYYWSQGKDRRAGNESTLSVFKVADTGIYSYKYRVQDGVEPLWMYYGECADSEDLTITKGVVKLKDFEVTSPAYWGLRSYLSNVTFDIVVVNNIGKTVAGTAEWELRNTAITYGSNAHDIRFTPSDTDNYAVTVLEKAGTFEADSLYIIYNIDELHKDIKVEIEYDQAYSASNVVKMYQQEFLKRIDENDPQYDYYFVTVENKTPFFDDVEISKYSTDRTNVIDNVTIEVTYFNLPYTVTYDPDNGDATWTETQDYNRFLLEPTRPTLAGSVFLGWYLVDNNGDLASDEWDFDKDRVTSDMTLRAKWFEVTLTLESIEIMPKSAYSGGYDALTVIDSDEYLKVIAHYTTNSTEQQTYDEEISISLVTPGGYTLTYESSDGKLHVRYPHITVTYSYGGVTKSVTDYELKVNPLQLDMTGVTLADKTVVYTGTPQSITKISESKLPIDISKVDYVYSLGGEEIDESQVINYGTYTVTAVFTTTNPDYKADPITATLTITRPSAPVTVEWDATSFDYNAKVQHPTAIFKDEDGNILDFTEGDEFHYIGDLTAIAVGSSYNIAVVIDDTSYSISGATGTKFSIIRAILDTPTVKESAKIVYTGSNLDLSAFLDGFD